MLGGMFLFLMTYTDDMLPHSMVSVVVMYRLVVKNADVHVIIRASAELGLHSG
jgi:hypothetical protein